MPILIKVILVLAFILVINRCKYLSGLVDDPDTASTIFLITTLISVALNIFLVCLL